MLKNKRIPISYIFKKVKYDVLLVISFTTIVIVIKQFLHIPFDLSVSIPAFLGTAITLVLAFKLNQSYDRWWEGRKIWGAIVNDSRTLVLQFKSFYSGTDSSLVNTIAFQQIAWCYSLVSALRKLNENEKTKVFLGEYNNDLIKKSKHKPLAIHGLITQNIKEAHAKGDLNDYQQIQIDKTLVRLIASMGKAERIKNTVFPKTYRIFLRFFIYIFLLTLAISLSDLHPGFEIPLLVTISLPFFLLKKTSVHMQDPFDNKPTDTAILSISETIEQNLKELVGDESEVKIDSEHDFFAM